MQSVHVVFREPVPGRQSPAERHQVISLATGSKRLPVNRLSERAGESVNDSVSGETYVVLDRGTPVWDSYRLRDAMHIYMYISTVPCTSIEFIIIARSGHPGKDATPRCGF